MHKYAAQALKTDEGPVIDGTKAQALANALQAVSKAVGKEQHFNLLNKEAACCRIATD